MIITNLRKVGGSVMLAIPPTVLDILGLSAGDSVAIEVEDGRLIVKAYEPKPSYQLKALLKEHSPRGDLWKEVRGMSK